MRCTQNNLPIIEEKIDVKEELTEEKLLEIIKIAENSPEPESSVNIDENIQEQQFLTSNGEDRLHFESEYSALVKNYYDFLDSLNSEIKEYEFEDKTKVVPIKNEISKELTFPARTASTISRYWERNGLLIWPRLIAHPR